MRVEHIIVNFIDQAGVRRAIVIRMKLLCTLICAAPLPTPPGLLRSIPDEPHESPDTGDKPGGTDARTNVDNLDKIGAKRHQSPTSTALHARAPHANRAHVLHALDLRSGPQPLLTPCDRLHVPPLVTGCPASASRGRRGHAIGHGPAGARVLPRGNRGTVPGSCLGDDDRPERAVKGQ